MDREGFRFDTPAAAAAHFDELALQSGSESNLTKVRDQELAAARADVTCLRRYVLPTSLEIEAAALRHVGYDPPVPVQEVGR